MLYITAGTVILARAYFVRTAARADPLRPDLVFVITFPIIIPITKKKIVKKDAPRDFYNLRLKSDAKIKYYQNYSNSATQITLVTTTYYSCNLVLN